MTLVKQKCQQDSQTDERSMGPKYCDIELMSQSGTQYLKGESRVTRVAV